MTEVKVVRNRKIAVTILLTIFALSLIPKSYAKENGSTQTFYHHDEAGLIIKVEAPANTEPGQKINVSVSFYCYAENLSISYLHVAIFDFKSGQEKTPIETIRHVEKGIGYNPQFNETYAQAYEVEIGENVWDISYGEVSCQWTFGGHTFYIRDDGFTMTYVQNVKMEELIEQLTNKTQEYDALSQNYTELNQTYTQLNQTYWELKLNQTSGTEGQLSNTRLAMVIFIVTTVFFAATTLYLVIKKPKQYW